MPGPDNPSFEDADASTPPGPLHWTIFVNANAVEIADFGGTHLGYEDFEGWVVGFLDTLTGNVAAATFTSSGLPKPFEAFTKWEGVEGYFFGLPSTEAAVFNGADAFEAFTSWATGFLFAFAGALSAASFADGLGGHAGVETFEGGWHGNEAFATTMGSATAAVFQGNAFENFENVVAPNPFTVNVSTNVITTSSPHGWITNDGVLVALDSDHTPATVIAQLPGGLRPTVLYRAIVLSPTTLKLSYDGATPITITDQGSGAFVLLADPTLFWTRILT